MVFESSLNLAFLPIAAVDVEVLGAHVEVVLVSLCEVEAMGVDGLPVVACPANRGLFGRSCGHILRFFGDTQETEVLRVNKDGRAPIAHLSVVAD